MNEQPAFLIELYQDGTDTLQFLGDKLTIQLYQTYNGRYRPSLKIDCYRQPDGTLVNSVDDWTRNEPGPTVMTR